VVEVETGVFFDLSNSSSLAAAIQRFERYSWDQGAIRRHAEKFDSQVFATRFIDFLSAVAPGVLRDELRGALPVASTQKPGQNLAAGKVVFQK
jgi:hypothetical protein